MTPKRYRWTVLAPVDAMPSICLSSTFSSASEKILPKLPVSVTRMASAPVSGPGPKARDSMIVQINASTPRTKSKTLRNPKRTMRSGVKLRAARKASGKAIIAAPKVPRKAIKIVSPIAQTTSECRHIRFDQKSCHTPVRLLRFASSCGPNARASGP